MFQHSKAAEEAAILSTAQRMCAAARTAPKTKGDDLIETAVLTGDELETLAVTMEQLSGELGYKFFLRDANNIRQSGAVVLIGVKNAPRGLGDGCSYCGYQNCAACTEAHGVCAYGPIDLGIAVGAATSIAADARVDNRVMFSAGRAALSLGLLGEGIVQLLAIPLSVSGKSPYFDRVSPKK